MGSPLRTCPLVFLGNGGGSGGREVGDAPKSCRRGVCLLPTLERKVYQHLKKGTTSKKTKALH
eukprot:4506508-Prorocentrum_lima.AAC.1